MKECIVIGGGIVGMCSAYYLAKAGHDVTIIDKSDLSDGCSYGNAGMIVPSHFIALAQPGMISKGLSWMFNKKSPFYVKPRLNSELLKWGQTFYRYANQSHVDASAIPLLELSLFSKDLYRDMIAHNTNIFYRENGLLMLYKTERIGDEERKVGEMAKSIGLQVDILNHSEVVQLENGLDISALGGVHFKSDALVYPNQIMEWLKQEIKNLNVKICSNQEVVDFKLSSNSISSLLTTNNSFTADEFILCTGAWSPYLAKKLDVNIQLLPGKGYSFNTSKTTINQHPNIPSILCEGKVAVSPFENSVRFGGTMEITHVKDTSVNYNRVLGITETINSFYPTLKIVPPNSKDVWTGFRPCTPTGLPIISKHQKIDNLTICTGHGMMGVSLGPASGKIVEELISEKKPSVDINRFSKI